MQNYLNAAKITSVGALCLLINWQINENSDRRKALLQANNEIKNIRTARTQKIPQPQVV